MTTNNIFGLALKGLLDATKIKLSRKEWTVLLGVSDAAISQWVSGKTFPEAEKIQIILSVYRKYELNTIEKSKLDHFLSILEMPIDELWPKVPSKIKGLKASDYILESFEEDARNSVSHLFYDLKLELYQQLSREIFIHKEYLIDKLLEKTNDEKLGLHVRVRKNKLLAAALCDEANRRVLSIYAEKIKTFHDFYNELLRNVLNDSAFEAEELSCNFHSLLHEYNSDRCKKFSPVLTQGSFKRNTMIKNHEAVSRSVCWSSKDMAVPKAETLFNPFDIRPSSFEISFKDPLISEKDLLNIAVSKFSHHGTPMVWPKAKSVYCTFKYDREESASIRKLGVYTGANFVKFLRSFDSQDHAPDYAITFNSEDEETKDLYESVPRHLKDLFIKGSSRKRLSKTALSSYLIEPELTASYYSVEILNIENNSKIPISMQSANGLVFLLLGNIEVSPTNSFKRKTEERYLLTSLFDQSDNSNVVEELPECSAMKLEKRWEYEVQSRGCDSIALVVHYNEDHHPMSLRRS